MKKKRPAGKRVGSTRKSRAGLSGTAGSDEKRKAQLQQLVDFPGMNLAKLYVGVVRQSRELKDADNTPVFPNQVALLDQIGADVISKVHAQGDHFKTAAMVLKFMRANQAAERDRVQRYACETALGAAAMQVDGVNQLNRLRQELRAEKKTKKTIETITEEELSV